MIEFKNLRPKVPVYERPGQCEMPFDVKDGWSPHYLELRAKRIAAKGWDLGRCNKSAKYKINGKCLCQQHAAITALAILEKEHGGN